MDYARLGCRLTFQGLPDQLTNCPLEAAAQGQAIDWLASWTKLRDRPTRGRPTDQLLEIGQPTDQLVGQS